MIWKMRYEKKGGHVHCTLFVAKRLNTTFANCGDLCVREEEFEDLRCVMTGIEFVERAE